MVFDGKPDRNRTGLRNPEWDLSGVFEMAWRQEIGKTGSGLGCLEEVHAWGIAVGNGRLLDVG